MTKEAVEGRVFSPWEIVEYVLQKSIDVDQWTFTIKSEKEEKDPWERLILFRARIYGKHKDDTEITETYEFSVQMNYSNGDITFRMWNKVLARNK